MKLTTLKDFAESAGVIVGRCDKDWGGTWQYHTKDNPNSACCGFRTEAALYKGWAKDTFGEGAAKALQRLLNQARKA